MIERLADVIIHTDRLRIRPIEDADLQQIYAIHSDPTVNQHLPYDTWLSWDDARHWYAKTLDRQRRGEARQLVIETRSKRELVGTCIVFNVEPDQRTAEFGYVLARPAWKQGYMLEAMTAFIPVLHRRLDLDYLNASVEQDNTGSLSLLDKLRFSHVDTTIDEDGVHLYRLQKHFDTPS